MGIDIRDACIFGEELVRGGKVCLQIGCVSIFDAGCGGLGARRMSTPFSFNDINQSVCHL